MLGTVLGLMVPALLASAAPAQEREFSGEIRELGREELMLRNRRGDELRFQRVQETRVAADSGAVGDWGELDIGDFVTVRWKLADSPPVAYQVIVHSRGPQGEG